MAKYLRGDILVFTKRGLIRLDNLNKDDCILTYNNNELIYDEIDEIQKTFKKKYKLNKIKLHNYLDNYFINDNIKIKSIQNIPYEINNKDLIEYLNNNLHKCSKNSCINELSDFDYISFPFTSLRSLNKYPATIIDTNYLRFQGIILNFDKEIKLNNEYCKATIEFLLNFFNDNNINYNKEISFNYTTLSIISDLKKITLDELFLLTKDELYEFFNGIIEISNEFQISSLNTDEIYKIIKFTCLLLNINLISYYKDKLINIKILIKDKNINIIYNDNILNKIKSIKKIEYNGFLYSIKTKSNNYFLTELGLIS